MTDSRTANTDRLEFLKWMRDCLEANLATGRDIEDMIKDCNRAISRRERMEQPR